MMGKKLFAILWSVLLCISCILPCGYHVSAEAESIYVYDESGTLSDTDIAVIEGYMEDAADYTGMKIGLWVSGQTRSESQTKSFCDSTYDEIFGKGSDGVFLLIDCSGGYDLYDYISTSGLAQMYYTNSDYDNRIEIMIEDMDDYLPHGFEDVVCAVKEFCSDMTYYYDEGIPYHYYVYDGQYGQYMYVDDNGNAVWGDELPEGYTDVDPFFVAIILVIAAVIAALAGLIAFWILKVCYKFEPKPDLRNYLVKQDVNITERQDNFIRQYQTRVKIESSGGGGGGGGHSSGGHGGGGGHR